MPDKRWYFQLNQGVVYFVDIRGGKLTITSRVNTYEHDRELITVSIVRPYNVSKDEYLDFEVQVAYPIRNAHGWSRDIQRIPLTKPTLQNGKHILGGQIPVDIGPTYVVLEFSCDVGSFYGDYEFKPDTAECL